MPSFKIVVALMVATAQSLQLQEANSTDPVSAHGGRIAILMSGTADRVLIKPLMSHVLGPNARAGHRVDFFFSLRPPSDAVKVEYAADRNESRWLKAESTDRYTMDPKVGHFLQEKHIDHLMTYICEFAQREDASHCSFEVEGDDPLTLPDDDEHRSIMTYYNPITTQAGKAVLAKWRSLSSLWEKAKEMEKQVGAKYSSVLVVRDDAYWIANYEVNMNEFNEDPLLLKVIPCLESHGINDKAVFMGRDAADVMLRSYADWMAGGDKTLRGTRNAEEFWFKKALGSGLTIAPEPLPMAVAAYTTNGIPCFRKQTFNLTLHGGYQQCYGEASPKGPLTRLFHAFNCEELNPKFFDQIKPERVSALHEAIKALAQGDKRRPIILTITDASTAYLTRNMLASLDAVGEETHCLVVATSPGACVALEADLDRTAGLCVEVPMLAEGGDETKKLTLVQTNTFRHAVLTTVVLSGLAKGVMYTEPNVVFLQPPVASFRQGQMRKTMVFAMNNAMSDQPSSCEDVADRYEEDGLRRMPIGQSQRHVDLDSGLFYLQDTPDVADLLLRSWMNLVEKGDAKHSQRWALTHALEDASWLGVGSVPCDTFVNGNVFWGHRSILNLSRVVAVHATWMPYNMTQTCLERAGLWNPSIDQSGEPRQRIVSETVHVMGGAGNLQVMSCGELADAGAEILNVTEESTNIAEEPTAVSEAKSDELPVVEQVGVEKGKRTYADQ